MAIIDGIFTEVNHLNPPHLLSGSALQSSGFEEGKVSINMLKAVQGLYGQANVIASWCNKQFPTKDSNNDKKDTKYNKYIPDKGYHYCCKAACAVGTLSMSHPNIHLEISSGTEAIIINQG